MRQYLRHWPAAVAGAPGPVIMMTGTLNTL
jgi:hypothetical protein